ncbi:MAG: autotransporter domain-containing protein [Rhizobiaceae bacterium]|nr:autotransporter domain-containing protein [Rhizobiaceae bacterium]
MPLSGGIAQRGSGVHDLTIDLVNDGTIDIIASAEASSAYAYVSDAVRQSASATGDAGDTATVTLTNTSSLTLDIQANAIAKSDNARAIASMGHYPSSSLDDYEFVIGQQVSDADNAVITLDNSGTINLVANAMAEGASGAAGTQAAAQAGLYLAILQGASFDGSNHEDDPDVSNQTALLTLTNSGLINIKAVANANGNEAEAEATLHEGITQAAYEAAETSAILNNSGTLNILVEAVAKGTDYAIAKASNDDALSQYAAGNGDEGDIASVTLNNSGSLALINIRADATATANSAEAFATVDSGIEQYAEDVDEARVVLSNSGTLNVQAHAVAKGTDKAKAYVSVTDAIYQTASGNGNEGDIASVTLNNSGSLAVINIRADATATAKSAIATAIFETGIEQDASNADEATVLLNNSGTFNIIGNAIAHGVSQASASVDASYGGIWQEATAIEGGSFASASVNNSGTLSLQAQASATAETGAANATVTYEEAAFYQSATDGLVSTVSLANSGTLNIIGKAIAHGVSKATANAAHSQEEDEYASIWQAATAAEGGSLASVTINNSGTLSLQALATATAETGAAEASASYIYAAFHQSAGDGAINTVSLINSGNFDITRNAHAEGATAAYASAENAEEPLFSQQAGSDSDDVAKASAEIINSGDFLIESTAFAKAASGDATATVSHYYTQVLQKADDADEVVALLDNSGEFAILAHAQATGDNAKATVTADEPAFEQNVDTDGEDILAHAIVTNSGTFLISSDAIAKAHIGGKATAKAFIETGINQLADDADDTMASLTNDGLMSISVDASALVAGSSGTANASASMTSAIYQDADAEGRAAGEVKLVNTASLNITADAKAVAGDVANASAVLGSKTDEDAEYGPIIQYAKDGATVLVSINNSGELQIAANADAEAFDASALARASSIRQYVAAIETIEGDAASTATASFVNSGTVDISADANALGQHEDATTETANASAKAYANGLYQALDIQTDDTSDALVREFTAQFDNSGELLIVAEASATASAGTDANTSAALAEAIGYIGHTDTSGDTLDMDFTNSGFFVVSAMANVGGSGSVNAQAVGVRYESDILTGTFLNSEVLGAVAYASSDDDGGTARAVALDIITNDAGDASFVNTGMLAALAYGSDAQATAVSFADNNAFDTGDAAATFSNHGGYVYALISDEGGSASGTAFNTGGASYQVMLDLQGNGGEDGLIEGDIVFKAGDQIEATQGRTYFYGTINPSEEYLGELSVLDDGEFVLGNDETLGPTVSHVDQLTVHGDGTLGFEIDPDPDVSRIAADNVALDGTILVLARAGLYAESQTYQDVIVAGEDGLAGTFATEMSNSPLLNLTVDYDDDDTVDLTLTRNAFDEVAGLTPNQKSVAGSIESTYGAIDPDNDYGDLVEELFTLDSQELPDALDQLSGVEYSNTLQWALGSFNLFQDAVKYRINSNGDEGASTSGYLNTGLAGNGPSQEKASGWWARIQGAIGNQDDDGNASGYSYDEALALIGVDAVIDETFMIGAAGGFFGPGNLDFDNGNQVVQDIGYQVGGYAQYDNGTTYLRSFAGYGAWDASATRTLTIGGLSGVNNSSFDVSAWDISGEAGYDIQLDNATLTPFVGVSYTKASIGSYVETGFAASALAGNGGKGEALDGIAGIRLSGLTYKSGGMTIKPEGAVGYIHNFSDAVSLNNTLIAAPSGTSSFDTLGVDNNGGIFLDLGATVYYDQNVTFGFGYAGEYGTNHSEHSGFGKFNMNF